MSKNPKTPLLAPGLAGLAGLALAALALGACGKAGKFSKGADFRGAVEMTQWPPLPRGVAGYNLYMGTAADGKFEKINDLPITGGKMMIPYLEPGQEYFFKLSYVAKDGRESKPGGAFKRKAVGLEAPAAFGAPPRR